MNAQFPDEVRHLSRIAIAALAVVADAGEEGGRSECRENEEPGEPVSRQRESLSLRLPVIAEAAQNEPHHGELRCVFRLGGVDTYAGSTGVTSWLPPFRFWTIASISLYVMAFTVPRPRRVRKHRATQKFMARR